MTRNNPIKVLSLFGVMGVIFYFLHVFLGTIFYEGYNSFEQAISDLTASDSPSKNIASTFSFIYGIFTVIFSIVFFVWIRGRLNKIVTAGSCFFCIMTIISWGYFFFPLSEAGYAGTLQDKMHVVVTVFVVVFTIIAIILFSIGFLKTKKYIYLGIISLCAFLLLMTGAILLNILPKEYFGLAERINVFTTVLYTGILSLWMHKYTGTIYP
jgi:hypothetical membrane protein